MIVPPPDTARTVSHPKNAEASRDSVGLLFLPVEGLPMGGAPAYLSVGVVASDVNSGAGFCWPGPMVSVVTGGRDGSGSGFGLVGC